MGRREFHLQGGNVDAKNDGGAWWCWCQCFRVFHGAGSFCGSVVCVGGGRGVFVAVFFFLVLISW